MSDDLITIEMTTEAAQAFWKALIWASTQADEHGRDDHYDWLSWGQGRIGFHLAMRDEIPA
jgi:hypothetical protein